MWTGKTTGGNVLYTEKEQLENNITELVKQNKLLLTKIDAITKLVKQMLDILLSYNPKLAEQSKKELEKIYEQTDDTRDKPKSDTPG